MDEVVGMPTADQITAELEAGYAAQADPGASETAAPAPVEKQTEAPAAAPEPVAVKTDDPAAEPLTIADTALVVDPLDGKAKPFSEIAKSERLRASDATRKWKEAAEMKREAEALRQQFEAATAAEKIRAAQAALPALPDDDPFAQHTRLLNEKVQLAEQAIRTMQEQTAATERERVLLASRAALATEEKRMADDYKFSAREIGIVEDEYMRRRATEPGITLQSVAKDFSDYLAGREEAKVREFKDQHRVSSDAAKIEAPATGTAEEVPLPGAPGFAERIASEMSAMFGRR
ncbi:MAG: hypothetical protein WC829_02620 [Hyphomicrobium sp.]|jgi:hypothetical protein